jgi:N-acetylglucosaminyldiphosphoundecaprenol N-acetyl-beta-D-mannosaminyltransferase
LTPASDAAVRGRIEIGGFPLDAITARDVVSRVTEGWDRGAGGWIMTVNVDILRRLQRDRDFRALASTATLRVADGMPLVWASRIGRCALPERVAGSDLFWSLAEAAACCSRSVYFVGGAEGAAEATVSVLEERYAGFRSAGVDVPPFGFEADAVYTAALRDRIVDAGPDMVFVGLGCPKQDRLIASIRERLPSAWCVGLGIAFSFASGDVARAPKLAQRLGLEWAHRLTQEPRRLGRRYLVDDLPFAVRLLCSSAARRVTA